MLKTLFFFLLFGWIPLFCTAQVQSALSLPKIYALVIGVTPQYSQGEEELKYPQSDAVAFKRFLKSPASGSIPEEQITTLIGSKATRINILHAIAQIFSRVAKEDLVIFYYSGHGVGGNAQNEGYLVPYDYDPKYPNSSGVSMEFIAQKMSSCKAKMKQVYIDACHAGIFSNQDNFKGSSKDESISIASAFRLSIAKASGGFMAVLSSKGTEESREDSVLGKGVFTHFLLKGLTGAADEENDGVVNAVELESYLVTKVRDYTSNNQHPQMIGNYRPDFPMSVNRLNSSLKGLIKKNPGILIEMKKEAVNGTPATKNLASGICRDDSFVYGMCNFTNKTNRTLTLYKIVTRGTENSLGTCDCFGEKWSLKIPPGSTVKAPGKIKISWKGRNKSATEYLFYFSTPGPQGDLYARLQYPIEACKEINIELNESDFDFIKFVL